ncbi:FMN-dependent NADH-azoreductase [Clostridium saccharobutylicum]|uniref:FMN dependent NADH:quinone oxidoreductase n=1 Tax=Clostridium saccharobutylicum DSM 13864 TaxID=1345695 RepID=U5MUE3_CLOSA|nr:NAD(P)H-dependent oxidoreductase [Clostridium saccharobutylicum]AGX43057.1 FMN-dependent NADH-azoreductase AzoR [Clostridium saccharobutylicum DSM 13864]AQR90348.1 FMN-dependent NADH-azoreductase 2 [Clostridium saccharobutylicum]AQS00254.1 FMN-dependent NADH-azoreductase 2 [Clostridium saccharobutylicum]AQS14237.1 FMN-dependent NADH-azoreductase 2 [Clostridium saccharobutylicum]MBA2907605.1 FMN-dependent NADH-azoreductase [Clostridium saccharobutylicum]
MKKLLYITVNSKPEEMSSSKKVGRAFVNRFLELHNDFKLEELDLYNCYIPRLQYQYFEKRNAMIKEEDFNKLDIHGQEEVHKIVKLTDQFKEADMYVIAAPMWSLSFPAPLKEYIDCVVMDGKTISIKENNVEGLLNDKPRGMVYIQSSGGKIPWILRLVMNKGLNYVHDIMKTIGIKRFEELLVDGTGFTEEEKKQAINQAISKIDNVIDEVWRE